MLSSIYTLNQLNNILSDAQMLKPQLMKSSEPNWNALKDECNPDTVSLLFPLLKKSTNPLTKIDSLIETLHEHQLVEVTTAIELTPELIEQVGTFIKDKVGETAVFSNVVNPRLVGGAQISFNGKFKDYSLVSLMQQYFQSNKLL